MPLTEREIIEIRTLYRDAKNQDEQLRIISQLYLQPIKKIKEICADIPKREVEKEEKPKVRHNHYSWDFKYKMLDYYKSGHTIGETAEHFEVIYGTTVSIIRQAEKYEGKEKPLACVDKYPIEVRLKCCREIMNGDSRKDVAKRNKVPLAAATRWYYKYKDKIEEIFDENNKKEFDINVKV